MLFLGIIIGIVLTICMIAIGIFALSVLNMRSERDDGIYMHDYNSAGDPGSSADVAEYKERREVG